MKYHDLWLYLFIAAGLSSVIVACQPQTAPTSADYYERCDTNDHIGAKEWLQNKFQHLQEQLPAQHLKHDATILLNALQQNDFETAQNYATDYGLGTLLYLNTEQISHYEISEYKLGKKTALAYVRINQNEKPIRFEFAKADSIWQFKGIMLEDVENGTPFGTP